MAERVKLFERAVIASGLQEPEKPLPTEVGDVASEIAQIESVMKSDHKRYNRDEAMQTRYRTLLTRRG